MFDNKTSNYDRRISELKWELNFSNLFPLWRVDKAKKLLLYLDGKRKELREQMKSIKRGTV